MHLVEILIYHSIQFYRKVIVNKNTDNIRYGGNAIGGSVQIESGLIPKN